MRKSKCRGCGASIVFVESVAGKMIPCDPKLIPYWGVQGGRHKIVTPNGEVVSAELRGEIDKATGIGYISHFATCPAASQFKKK